MPDEPFISPLGLNTAVFSPGQVLLDRFRIVRLIGKGGMGEVYEAEDLQLGRVALKTIRPGIAASSAAFERFRQEVQTARKITGEQICRIHELYLLPSTESQPQAAFLTMEYLEGFTLAERLKHDGPIPLKGAKTIALDICEGLRLVHANGIIHRDLKSANIMLRGQGDKQRAVLVDFGLARGVGAFESGAPDLNSDAGSGATLPGTIVGTPAYMAPEQFEGKLVSPATDIYALGIVLYELVTGQHPYAAPTPVVAAIRRAHLPTRPSKLMRSVPRKWDRVIQRCLEYESKDRYQSANEVTSALRAGPADIANLYHDRPVFFWMSIAVMLVAMVWGAFNYWQRLHYYHPDAEARHWYDAGVASLHDGNDVKATRLLEQSVGKDDHYAMAHARLASAWFDLDFQGSAERELLIALPRRTELPPLDALLLDAIQASVTGDTVAAVERYKRVLDRLPSVDKSSGEVDLGVAYERAGDIPHALEAYTLAAAEDSNNPAAFLHRGVLKSRQHQVTEGNQAFERARAIFTAEVNTEGTAELDYEMGYAANDRGDSKDAEAILARALDEAVKIPSVQLEIRALTQLSSAESANFKDEQAVAHAQQAIQLARDNQLEPWAAVGLVRLANAQLVQLHLKEAEQPLTEAMQILEQSPQPRIQALANSALASLMDQEHQSDKVVEPATAALNYYKKNGFSEGAFSAALLLVRYERNRSQYQQALQDSAILLAAAQERSASVYRYQAEEAIGTIYEALEQFPDALKHYENAHALASNDTQRAYQELHLGEILWKLGRYAESEAMLKLASGSTDLATIVGKRRAESLLSQQQFRPALEVSRQLLSKDPNMPADRAREIRQDLAVAEAHLGMKQQALGALASIDTSKQLTQAPETAARDHLISADVYLELGMKHEAYSAAARAEEYFASSGQRVSQLRSADLAVEASKALNDEAGRQIYSKKVVDILNHLRQDWGTVAFEIFLARPDIRATARLGLK